MMVDSALRDEVIQRLIAVSDTKFAAADIRSETSLREDLDISSLTLVALATDLEEELGINIDDDVLGRIQTIGDLFKAIENSKPRQGSR